MQPDKHRTDYYLRRILLILLPVFCLSSAKAEFRTWKDKKGNSIHAELINTFGGKLVLKDKKGKVYRLDPDKLSKKDQLYLNPPAPTPPTPPRYKISFGKSSRYLPSDEVDILTKGKKSSFKYDFKLNVEFLTDDPVPEGFGGVLFVMGEDEQGTMVVIDKVDGPIEKSEWGEGQLKGQGCQLAITKSKDGKMVKGIKYNGYLIMLVDNDGTILEKQGSHGFLTKNPEKALTLFVGDQFNEKLEKVE